MAQHYKYVPANPIYAYVSFKPKKTVVPTTKPKSYAHIIAVCTFKTTINLLSDILHSSTINKLDTTKRKGRKG